MIQQKHRIFSVVNVVAESLVTITSFFLAYLIRSEISSPNLNVLFPLKDYLVLLFLVIVLWAILSILIRYRDTTIMMTGTEALKKTGLLVFSGSILVSATIFVLKYDFISRSFILIFVVLNFLLLVSFQIYARKPVRYLNQLLIGQRNLLIVGNDDRAAQIARVFEDASESGYHLVGVVPESSTGNLDIKLRRYPSIPLDELEQAIRNHHVDEVIFVVSKEGLTKMEDVFLLCEQEGVKTRIMLSFFPHLTSKIYLETLHELPLLTFTTTPQNDYLLLVKSAIDVIFAFVLLIVTSPLLAIIASLIKLTSKGPIIFKQVRCGLGGRNFILYKFRSMIENAEEVQKEIEHLNTMSGPVFKIGKDPRCTLVGKILRKFSLDELPQMINILKGDMSFVGPRPPIPKEVTGYLRWQRRRLRMKPGLTCLWQVRGRNDIDFQEWMELDLQYIDSWSLLLDVKIILKTIPIVLLGKGT